MKQPIYPKNIIESIIVIALFILSSGIFSGINLIFNEPINKHIVSAIGMIFGMILTKKILERFHFQKFIFNLKIDIKSNLHYLIWIITFIFSVLIPVVKFISSKYYPDLTLTNPLDSIFFILAGLIVAPIIEEILFRGIILRGLLANFSPQKAIAISSILFAIIHFNFIQILTSLIMGVFLGLLFFKTKNLSSCIIFHFCINFAITLSSYLHYKFGNPEVSTITDIYGQYSNYIILVTSLLFLVVSKIIYDNDGFSLKPKVK